MLAVGTPALPYATVQPAGQHGGQRQANSCQTSDDQQVTDNEKGFGGGHASGIG